MNSRPRVDPNDKSTVDDLIREVASAENAPLIKNMVRGTEFIAVAYTEGRRLHLSYEYLGEGKVVTSFTRSAVSIDDIDQATVRSVKPPEGVPLSSHPEPPEDTLADAFWLGVRWRETQANNGIVSENYLRINNPYVVD